MTLAEILAAQVVRDYCLRTPFPPTTELLVIRTLLLAALEVLQQQRITATLYQSCAIRACPFVTIIVSLPESAKLKYRELVAQDLSFVTASGQPKHHRTTLTT